ncbi:DUF1622 domain-containing protein [Kribbella sp. NPDC051718]|uniref:DUF1622 domain-containing protein n=1 Tax=Kribbella sp. NPDC051718 TaxID=3155168 RepID=UPI003449E3ED
MSFEELFADVARVIEGVGVVIMTVGLVSVLLRYAYAAASASTRSGSYERLRVSIGRVILLGLEILIVGDIVRTIIVEASVQSVLVLGLIVVIRTVLSFALEVEISGRWPWQQSPHTTTSPTVPSPEPLEEK